MESKDKREQEQKGGKRAAETDPQRKQDPNRPGGNPDQNPDRNRENERGDRKR